MKKSIFLILILAFSFSCKKDDDDQMLNIKNLSGVDWYNAEVWFADGEDGELVDNQRVGNVPIGNSCEVRVKGSHYYIYASDASGRLVMSRHKSYYENTVRADDLY